MTSVPGWRCACLQAGSVSCRVAPLPDGTVRAFFRPEKAGPYSLAVSLAGAQGGPSAAPNLNAMVHCVPGPMNIATSIISRQETDILAGRTGQAIISCCDIFGNPTCIIPVVPVTLIPSGKLRAWWNRAPKSSQLFIHFSSQAAGQCTLAITAPEGGASLAGSPLQIIVKPDVPCAARCIVAPRTGKRSLTPETASLTAGALLCSWCVSWCCRHRLFWFLRGYSEASCRCLPRHFFCRHVG
jgi:hypothetical protein